MDSSIPSNTPSDSSNQNLPFGYNNSNNFSSTMPSSPTITVAPPLVESALPIVPYNYVSEFIAGSIGGALGTFTGYPLDTIKVRLQTNGHLYQYKATRCLSNILQKEGPFAFYKGLLSPLCGEAANLCVSFGIFGYLKRFQEYYNYNFSSVFVSGAITGVVCSIIVCPSDIVKINLQSNMERMGKQSDGSKGLINCANYILKYHGIRKGIYKGFLATIARDVPFSAMWYAANHVSRQLIVESDKESSIFPTILHENPTVQALCCGGFAGMAAWGLAFPLDTIKSQIQLLSHDKEVKRDGYMQVVRDTYQRGGWKLFYKGFLPCLLRAFPVNAVTFLGYEYMYSLLNAS